MYSANMKHTRETILRLSKIQYETFHYRTLVIKNVFSLLLMAAGIFSYAYTKTPGVLLLTFFGCWMMTSCSLPYKERANKIYQAMKDQLTEASYQFKESRFSVQNGDRKESLPYSRITHLIQDKEYVYLFISKELAYMVPKAALQPGDVNSFCCFLEEKANMSFESHAPFQVLLWTPFKNKRRFLF